MLTKKDRLKTLLSLQAESYDLKQQLSIAQKVITHVQSKGIKLTWDMDALGNVSIVKGKPKDGEFYPAVVAHLDQVHIFREDYDIIEHKGCFMAISNYEQVGCGGDDLVGVWLCLECLLALDACKVVLFVDEEVGCLGSTDFDTSFFEDCCFILQGDRRSDTNDFVNYTNGVNTTTNEFNMAVDGLLGEYGYKFNIGSMTDVGELIINGAGCCAANVSCGYYEAHTDIEIVNICEAMLCLELFIELFTQFSGNRWSKAAETPASFEQFKSNMSMKELLEAYYREEDPIECRSCEGDMYVDGLSSEYYRCEDCGKYELILNPE
jgi:putative aminopeptidase FrvX